MPHQVRDLRELAQPVDPLTRFETTRHPGPAAEWCVVFASTLGSRDMRDHKSPGVCIATADIRSSR